MNNPKPNYPPLRYLSPWHRVSRQLADHLRARSEAVGAPPTESHLVSYLGSYAPVTIGRLVAVFGHNKSTLTGMLDRLEQAGLAARTPNPDDRRSFLVDLTDAGRAVAARIRGQLEEVEAALDTALGPDDRAAFARIMAAIARVAGAPAGPTDGVASGPSTSPATDPAGAHADAAPGPTTTTNSTPHPNSTTTDPTPERE
ncbi:winged helix-turn-helix transcriptional regulator [bacterium]|nr:winged helix-turn-helix transcriptional regulator [bacterium]